MKFVLTINFKKPKTNDQDKCHFVFYFEQENCLNCLKMYLGIHAAQLHGHDQTDLPSPIAQSVASPTADPGVVCSTHAQSHTFIEFDREIISMVILLLQLIQEGLLSVTSKSMCIKYLLTTSSSLPRKKCG